MPMPELSRRSVFALVAVIAGIVAITVALLSGSGSSDGATGSNDNRVIEPVAPIDPNDADAKDPKDGDDPLSAAGDPFAKSFGANVKHKVTVRVSSDSTVRYSVRFRDGHEEVRTVSGGVTITRTVKGGFPLAQVGAQTSLKSTRGSCSVSVDGVTVVSQSTSKSMGVVVCTG